MVSIVIKHNFPEVERQLDQLPNDIRNQALVRAINRTVEPARPDMAREIAKEFNVTVTKAKEALRINKAGFKKGKLVVEASLESPARRGRSLNLINFIEKTPAAVRKRQAGSGIYQLRAGVQRVRQLQLRFKIRRGGPWKTIPGAFIGNQGRTVFIRTGKGRMPIKALRTIDIAQMFNARRINDRVRKGMLDRFPEKFAAEAKFYLDRFNERRAGR